MQAYSERILARLGDRDPLAVLAATPARFADLVRRLGDKGLERSQDDGKWSARQILIHLVDAELPHAFRVRQALTEEAQCVQTHDRERWVHVVGSVNASRVTATFCAVRIRNPSLFRTLTPEQFGRLASHPERDEESVGHMLAPLGSHDLNHLDQLEAIAAVP